MQLQQQRRGESGGEMKGEVGGNTAIKGGWERGWGGQLGSLSIIQF